MSRTLRNYRGDTFPDGDVQNYDKDKKPKKRFMYRGDGWSSKARGGVGNKVAWKSFIPKWLFKKLKKES